MNYNYLSFRDLYDGRLSISETSEASSKRFDILIRNILNLVPEIRKRRLEMADAGLVPVDLMHKIKETGVLGMGLPQQVGGMDCDSIQIMQALELFSYADASVGWVLMVGMDGAMYPLPEHSTKSMFGSGDVLVSGMLVPCGYARYDGSNYVLSGKWTMASGFYNADYVASGAFVYESDGSKRINQEGYHEWRVFVLPKEKVASCGQWNSCGLAATSSVDYTIDNQIVHPKYSFKLGKSDRVPGKREYDVLMRKMPAVALGVCRAALDYVREIVKEKVSTKDGFIWKDSYPVQVTIGECEMLYVAAREAVYGTLSKRIHRLKSGKLFSDFTPDERIDTVVARAFAMRQAREIVRKLYDLTASASVYAASPMDQWLRDLETMNQHLMAQEKILQSCGAWVIGGEPEVPIALGVAPAILN